MTRAAYCFDLLPPDDPLFLRQSVCQTSPTGGMMISVNRYADQVLVMQSLNGTDSSTLEMTAALAFAVAMELLAAAAVGNPSWPLIKRAPVSPASGTPERQSHTDGPSTPAPSGGHPNYFPDDVMAMAREARVTRALRSSEARLAAALSPTHAPAAMPASSLPAADADQPGCAAQGPQCPPASQPPAPAGDGPVG